MRSIIFSCLVLACSIVFTTSKSVALPVDFIDNGNYTTDTLSGLDWLDLDRTKDMTGFEVIENLKKGGSLYGWRLANPEELVSLISNWSGMSIDIGTNRYTRWWRSRDMVHQQSIFDLLGGGEISGNGFFNAAIMAKSTVIPDVHDYLYIYEETEKNTFFFSLYSDGIPSRGGGEKINSLLVRDTSISVVPLPATVWLFSAALGIIGWLARRRKENRLKA